eukprot:TRINITY_DN4120_c0_g1_i2.p1 TRINITY_DN4120_c0_g1~~TRINITY_DN4120_c0_g1_i2.p1  ORF type:complete len:521 (-),score=63.13 TRINITY_DN4120_c0_g1_i2:28-1590(-)
MKGTIYPEATPSEPSASEAGRGSERSSAQGFFAGRSDDIRKVYARWERSLISDHQFKQELRGLGFSITAELERLLNLYGPAKSMPFNKLMYALQIESNDGRRARNAHGNPANVPELHRQGAGGGVAASSGGLRADSRYFDSGACSQDGVSSYSDINAAEEELPGPSSLRQAICDFVDCHIPAVAFRTQLQRFGVPMTPHLDRLIRTHECDNSVRFQDLARLMLRQDKQEQFSYVPSSGASTPRGSIAGSAVPSVQGSASGYARSGAITPTASSHSEASRRFAPPVREGAVTPTASSRSEASRRFAPPVREGGPPSSAASGRGNSMPYAAGGAWSEDGYGRRTPSEDARSAAYHSEHSHEVQTPWATGQAELAGSRRAHSEASSSRGYHHRNHGDIIGWNDRPSTKERVVTTTKRGAGVHRPSGGGTSAPGQQSFLHWGEEPSRNHELRPGKRFFGQPLPASVNSPYGISTDISQPAPAEHAALATPFGTDADMRLRRPEEAGTDEYRSATARSGGRRMGR